MVFSVQQTIFTELAEFFANQPTLEQLAEFRVSANIQAYVDSMLERNREEGLSPEERLEFERVLAVIQMMDIAKTKAQLKLAGKS